MVIGKVGRNKISQLGDGIEEVLLWGK